VGVLRGSAQAVNAHVGAHSSVGSCRSPLPPLPGNNDDEDDATALHVTTGAGGDDADEATVIKLVALVLA
jgi:hypothetical protein